MTLIDTAPPHDQVVRHKAEISAKGVTATQPWFMPPFVRLCLEHWGETLEPSGAPVISAHLMTEQEIETHILNLKADLDRVGAEAKRALHKAVVAHRTDPSKY